MPASVVEEPHVDLDRLDDVIDEELKLLEEEKEENEVEELVNEMEKDDAKQKLKIETVEPKLEDE